MPSRNPITRHIEPLTITSAFSYADSGTVPLTFTVSGTDVLGGAVVDSATVPLLFGIVNLNLPVDYGTVYLQFNFYGLAALPDYDTAQFVDSGTVQLFFSFASDDCFSIITPHWHLDVVKRWTTTDVTNRWTVVNVQNRWDVWVIGVPIDNPCPDPTFAEMP